MRVLFAVATGMIISSVAMAATPASPLQAPPSNGMTSASSTHPATTPATLLNGLTGINRWQDIVHISLLLNADTFFQSNYQSLSLDAGGANRGKHTTGMAYNARLNIDSNLNAWLAAHLSLLTASGSSNYPSPRGPYHSVGEQPYGINGGYGTRYYVNSDQQQGIDVDEAYVAIGAKSPFALRLGRQYLPFGQYDLNAMMPSLYDQASKTRQQALVAGYYGQLGQNRQNMMSLQGFAFNGVQTEDAVDGSASNNVNSWGVTANYATARERFATNLQASYLSNYLNTGLLSEALDQQAISDNRSSFYRDAVGAVALDASGEFRRFMLAAHYIFPTSAMNSDNELYRYHNGVVDTQASLKPRAGSLVAGVAFDKPHPSQIKLSYQWSKDYAIYTGIDGDIGTSLVTLPKQRFAGEYTMALFRQTELGFELNWDKPYSSQEGGSGDQSNVITALARLSILLS